MGEMVRNFDWSKTAVGPLSQWPISLHTTLGIILHSRFPMFLCWGMYCFVSITMPFDRVWVMGANIPRR